MNSLQKTKLSMLDLVAVREGGTVAEALEIARPTCPASPVRRPLCWLATLPLPPAASGLGGMAASLTILLLLRTLCGQPIIFQQRQQKTGSGSWAARGCRESICNMQAKAMVRRAAAYERSPPLAILVSRKAAAVELADRIRHTRDIHRLEDLVAGC